MSKYARSQANDLRWIRAGILSGLVSVAKVKARIATTTFLVDQEQARVRALSSAVTGTADLVSSASA